MTRIKILTTGQTGASRAASATSVTRVGNIGATDVQAALEELDAEKQPLDSDLTAIAALSTQSFGRSLLTQASASAARTTLGVDYTTIAADTALTSRFGPSVFTVDSYLASLSGTTPSTATSAQTIAAYNAARDAAYAVGGTVKFTPGQTYQIDTTFIIKTGMVFDCTRSTLKKRSTTGKASPLIVNEDWANGNPDILVIAHGATWDFNGRVLASGSGEPYGGLGDVVHFQNCDRLTIVGRPLIKDGSKFALCIGHANDISVDGARFDTRSDGVHLYGPMKRADFGVFSGTTGDDFFALTISDYPAQITNLTSAGEATTLGDFEDITVKALQISNSAVPTGGGSTGSGFAILGNSSTYKARRVYVGSITGATKKAIRIVNDATLVDTNVEDVTVDKVSVALGSASSPIEIAPSTLVSLSIGELTCTDGTTSTPVSLTSGTIGALNIGRFTHKASTTTYAIVTGSAAVVGEVNIGTVDAVYGTNGRLFQHNSTSACQLNITNWRQSGAGWGLFCNNSAGVLTANVVNAYLSVGQVARVDTATLYLFAANMTADNCTQLFNLNSASAVMRFVVGSMRQVASSDRAITKTAGALFSATGASFRVPVDTKLDGSASLAGDIVYNSVASTTGLGLAQWNGSAWALV